MTINLLIENLKKRINQEQGQAFLLVLVLMLFGALIIVPLLNFIGTGVKTGTVYEKKTSELYAADSGINNGLSEIKNNGMQDFNPAINPDYQGTAYSSYDFNSSWPLELTSANSTLELPQVNGKSVNATINNEWIPKDLPLPSPENAKRLISGFVNPMPPPPFISPELVITSIPTAIPDASHPGTLEIKIQYSGSIDMYVNTLGIWLPPGYFTGMDQNAVAAYVTNHTNLGSTYQATLNVSPYKGGWAIIWSFGDGYPFIGTKDHEGNYIQNPFPNLSGVSPIVSTVTFQFTAASNSLSPPLAWIDTNLDLAQWVLDPTHQDGNPPVSYTWDGNVLVYHIKSIATTLAGTSTQVDTYLTKYQLRTVTASVNGDYVITGGSLMNASLADIMANQKDSVKTFSSNSIQPKDPHDTDSKKIPSDATVLSAILYWSGWLNQGRGGSMTVPPFPDTADTFNNWINGTAWTLNAGNFKGGGSASGKDILLTNALNLSSYGSTGTINVSLDQPVLATLSPTSVPPLNPDAGNNLANWANGNAWSSPSGTNYKGVGGASGKDFLLKNVLNLGQYGSTGSISVSLDTPVLGTPVAANIPPLNPDTATNFNNWNNGNAWSAPGTNFKGGGGASGKDLTLKNALLNLSNYGTNGSINVSIDPPTLATLSQTSVPPLNPDTGNNLANWTNGNAWSSPSGTSYKGVGGASGKDFLLKNVLNLGQYGSTGSINVSLDTPVLSTPVATNIPPLNPDTATNFNNWNNGNAWSAPGTNFKGGGGASGKDLTLKNALLNLSNYGTTGNINVSIDPPTLATLSPTSVSPFNPDQANNFTNWAAGSAWDTTTSAGKFTGWTYNKTSPGRDMTSTGLNLSTYGSTGTINITWDQSLYAGNAWSTMTGAPAAIAAGASLAYDGSNYIYALKGGSTTFYRYSISGNSWSTMTAAPAAIGAGGALAYDSRNSNYIYALRGGSQTTFYRYSISGNSWSTMTAAPASIGAGGALAYGSNSNYIYALRGGGNATFYRYNISNDSWSTSRPDAPGSIGAGGSLVFDGVNYIYALRGGGNTSFYRYSISGDSWSTMTVAPAAIGDGGALDYPGSGDYVYVLRGGSQPTFYRYSISGNSWSTMTGTPGNVTTGGALCLDAGGYAYAFQGGTTAFWRYTPAPTYTTSDGLDISYYNGSSWIGPTQIFRGGSPGAGSFTLSGVSLPSNFQIRFSLVGLTGAGEYLYLDNINISVTPSYASTDGLDLAYSLNGGATWTTNHVFTGNLGGLTTSWTIPNGTLPTNFLVKFSLVGFNGSSQFCYLDNINVSVTPSYASTDGLDLAYSLNGGSTWTTNHVFTGNLSGLATSWTIPDGNLPSNFLIKFSLVGFVNSAQSCTIDNIYVKVTPSYASTDGLDLAYSLNGGSTWTTNHVFTGNLSGLTTSWTIPDGNLPSNFLLKFSLVGFNGSSQFCYLDNINVSVTPSYASTDGLDLAYSLNGGSTWTTNHVFTGNLSGLTTSWTIPNGNLPSNFLIKFSLVGFVSSAQSCTIDNIYVKVTPVYSASDGLDFSYSLNGGSTWTTQPVFRGTGTPTNSFAIPNIDLPTNFSIKFSLVGLTGIGQYCTIDNILLTVDTGLLPSADQMNFNVNGHSQVLSADPYDPQEVISKGVINSSGVPEGYYYAVRQDVTALIKQYSDGGNWNANPKVDGHGSGSYTLSPVAGSLYPLADVYNPDGSRGHSSYAGWSLVIVYSSPETKGNYLKLYDWNYWPDKFSEPSNLVNPSRANVFDVPVTGFVVPKQETGETDAAKVTIFVGEGDPQITGDYVALMDQSNPTTENQIYLSDGSNTNTSVPILNLANGGSGYASAPTVIISGGGGSGASATANLTNGSVSSLTMINGGIGYTTVPSVSFSGGGGTGAVATATLGPNVWNGQSAEFPSEIGIDIDTFHILWNDPYNGETLKQDDTLANMRFYTNGDGYVLIYMITSFRSTPSTGGSMIYTIK